MYPLLNGMPCISKHSITWFSFTSSEITAVSDVDPAIMTNTSRLLSPLVNCQLGFLCSQLGYGMTPCDTWVALCVSASTDRKYTEDAVGWRRTGHLGTVNAWNETQALRLWDKVVYSTAIPLKSLLWRIFSTWFFTTRRPNVRKPVWFYCREV